MNSTCATRGDVGYWFVRDGGHSWPGSHEYPLADQQQLIPGTDNPPTRDLITNDAIWEFFQAHPRP
ncbi:MAG: hypothetical protein R3B54_10050 [Bdellovibrionota bacterium]